MNISMARDLIKDLCQFGVRDFVVCPGGRNAPLVKILVAAERLNVISFYEERSAAFFALGIAKAKGRPVAVVTTSGTAVAELSPAMIEACYAGVPLIAVTADRPGSYRGTGAPQAMNQLHFFGEHAADFCNWSSVGRDPVIVFRDQPVHINIEFDEPLIDEAIGAWSPDLLDSSLESKPKGAFGPERFLEFDEFSIIKSKSPLVLVSGLTGPEAEFVGDYFDQTGVVFFAEATSNLRHRPNARINLPKRALSDFDSVIRIGGVPTQRLWRDLEKRTDLPVFSFSRLPFSGLARSSMTFHLQDLGKLRFSVEQLQTCGKAWGSTGIWNADQAETRIRGRPKSELTFVASLSKAIDEGDVVFLGNSLPIREWDLVAEKKRHQFFFNRGMNGIDGLIATFLGVAAGRSNKSHQFWMVIGDLSTLYDLQSLQLLKQVNNCKLRIVVLNNSGGRIFRPMFKDEAFENQHSLNFEAFATAFGWSYLQWTEGLLPVHLPDAVLIEAQPDLEQSLRDWTGE